MKRRGRVGYVLVFMSLWATFAGVAVWFEWGKFEDCRNAGRSVPLCVARSIL